MRLQTRLTLATASIISLVSVCIGSFALSAFYNSDVARVDDSLSVAAKVISKSTATPTGSALLAADQSQIGLTIDYLTAAGDLLELTSNSVSIVEPPSLDVLRSSLTQPVTVTPDVPGGGKIDGTSPYRLRSVALSDGQYVLISTSLAGQIESRDANIRLLIWFVLGSVALGAAAIAIFIRRDVRKISNLVDAATAIAEGEASVELPIPDGDSEVDRLARALRNMVDSLQRAILLERDTQQKMQNFLGDASHELRTPLTVIKGYVELLQKNPEAGAEQTAKAYGRMLSEANRMDDLVRDLLLLAELGENKTETKMMSEVGPIDLSAMVGTALDDLRVLQPTRPVVVAVEPAIEIVGARDLIAQMLANLTSNIRRHTLVTDALRVSLHTEGGMAVLSFDDGGLGLPEEFYVNGIGHFKRFDNSRSRQSGGSGLGMSILAAIVRRHGGEVKLEKSDLGGLRTEIRLPVAR